MALGSVCAVAHYRTARLVALLYRLVRPPSRQVTLLVGPLLHTHHLFTTDAIDCATWRIPGAG